MINSKGVLMEIANNLTSENYVVKIKNQNKALKNTYLLLSIMLLFSAITVIPSALVKLPYPSIVITLAGYIGLLFLMSKLRNSTGGIYSIFVLTGFIGYTITPIIGAYWVMAPAIVVQSMAGTAAIILGLSTFLTSSKRDFSFLGTSPMISLIAAFLIGIGALAFETQALSLVVSAMLVILMSGLILYEVNQTMRGGETNYIMATVALFVSIYNLFIGQFHLLGFAQSK
jgi:modulator of FtsH protease